MGAAWTTDTDNQRQTASITATGRGGVCGSSTVSRKKWGRLACCRTCPLRYPGEREFWSDLYDAIRDTDQRLSAAVADGIDSEETEKDVEWTNELLTIFTLRC